MTQAEVLNKSAEEALQAVERHRDLLRAVRQTGETCMDACLVSDCPHRRKLRETLLDTVETLEQTRKAFKSKQLEILRKRLIGVLAEDA